MIDLSRPPDNQAGDFLRNQALADLRSHVDIADYDEAALILLDESILPIQDDFLHAEII